jgi:uncharacterized SAM-binding protein YcdF (DUF218 family)
MSEKKRKYDCIIVLGGGVNKDGSCPEIVKNRLELTIKFYLKKLSNKIILSGKVSKLNPNKKISEAKAMQNYLLIRRIPNQKIILEDKSTTTFENAVFLKRICQENKWNKIILITSAFHMKRAKSIFKFFFGKDYKFLFKAAHEGDVDKKLLKKRMVFEKAFLKLIKKELLDKNKKGDSEGIYHFLKDSSFKDKVNDLNEELKDYKKFY